MFIAAILYLTSSYTCKLSSDPIRTSSSTISEFTTNLTSSHIRGLNCFPRPRAHFDFYSPAASYAQSTQFLRMACNIDLHICRSMPVTDSMAIENRMKPYENLHTTVFLTSERHHSHTISLVTSNQYVPSGVFVVRENLPVMYNPKPVIQYWKTACQLIFFISNM